MAGPCRLKLAAMFGNGGRLDRGPAHTSPPPPRRPHVNDFPPPADHPSVVKKASSIPPPPSQPYPRSLATTRYPPGPEGRFYPVNGFRFDGFGKFFLFSLPSRVCAVPLPLHGSIRSPHGTLHTLIHR